MPCPDWLDVTPGEAPLIVSLPHTGTELPPEVADRLASPWLALKDTDWWIDRLYAFAGGLGATVVRTRLSRTLVDVNRDPSGATLYPGLATTSLCPTTTFDGEPLYRPGLEPDEAAIAERRRLAFEPYHAALAETVARLRARHPVVVLYDGHSIRSVIPRLFDGELPACNVGTNGGRSCDPGLAAAIAGHCAQAGFSHVTDGRFKGGWITRRYGRPEDGVHAVQMELACRTYMREVLGPVAEGHWPVPYDPDFAAPMQAALHGILTECLRFAGRGGAVA